MGGILAAFWLAGAWIGNPGNALYENDAFGIAITVGATVKMIGIVTSINPLDPHFGDIAVTWKYPSGQKVSPVQTGNFAPTQLVVGS